jgi:uncharacterized protein YqhQ
VIEGVMMRGPHSFAVSVRVPDGNIKRVREWFTKISERFPLFKLPLLRGIAALIETLIIGIKGLSYSARLSLPKEEEKENKKSLDLTIGVSLILAFLLGFLIFFFLPLYLSQLLSDTIPFADTNIGFNFIDGVLRVLFFLLYLLFISQLKEIKRVFAYHGAEHKAVFTYETGLSLTPENARAKSPLHPRCGTGFLLTVMVVSILVFTLIPRDASFFAKLLFRLIALPLIAGISYELLMFGAKYRSHPLGRVLTFPSLLLQRLTTAEPDEAQLEVALSALSEVVKMEKEWLRKAA